MKTSLYFNYASRSLLRGGQRTILAVFCVAVGVMAVVALQLVGFMIEHSLATNARDLNGGDIVVTATGVPLKSSDLSYFEQLKTAGTISNYTAVISATGSLSATASSARSFPVEAVDPGSFPLVSQPTFRQPGNGTVANLLAHDQMIVTQNFLETFQKRLDDTVTVYIKTNAGSGQTLQGKIAGVIANTGMFSQTSNLLLISTRDYLAVDPASLASYTQVDVTTADQAHTDAAVKAINARFPLISTQTAADLLKSKQSSIDMITKFLETIGLLSLLIGGIGIINTMQVLLSRRKTEIALLKTAGYRSLDLYLLFGLEAGLLGLIGGILGSAVATGVSFLVRNLIQNLGLDLPFLLNFWIIGGGIAIGVATALIFGLMPIVQAASVRPLNVIREQEMRGAGSTVLAVLLLGVLSLLFCALASMVLNNDILLGVEVTYGTFAFLLILSVLFGLVIFAVSQLPVPERFRFNQFILVLLGLAISALVSLKLPVFGLFGLIAALLGVVIVFLPRSWKVSIKMALRNLDRRRARTTTTMVALFIGILSIALVVGLGQGLQTQISTSLARNQPYNVVAMTSGKDTDTLQAQLHTIAGLAHSSEDPFILTQPVAINGQSPQKVLPTSSDDRRQAISFLSEIEGYHLAQHVPALSIIEGRNLRASDATTNNVIISELLTNTRWLQMNLKLGDTITFASTDGKTVETVHIVGIIGRSSSFDTLGKVLGSASVVNALGSASNGVNTLFYLKIDPAQVNHALDTLGRIVPNATVEDLSSSATAFSQVLNNFVEMLVTIASLSVIAAVIIIANAVALAMLERKRELGILKSVGYTSSAVLSEVLIENGIIGVVGSFIATLLAAGGIVLLGNLLFGSSLSIQPVVVMSLVLGSAVLAMLTALLVAWRSVRVRPLAVLRYE